MKTIQPATKSQEPRSGQARRRGLLVLALSFALLAAACSSDDDSGAVDATIEKEIDALVDDWLTARNTADGELAQSLFTADGRYVSRNPGLGGWSGEDLRAGVEEFGGAVQAERVASMIIDRGDSYYVAVKLRPFEFSEEQFILLNIVDESGTLKIRYTDDWAALGWFRLADDLPYRPVNVD